MLCLEMKGTAIVGICMMRAAAKTPDEACAEKWLSKMLATKHGILC